jgi:hypothetical protein
MRPSDWSDGRSQCTGVVPRSQSVHPIGSDRRVSADWVRPSRQCPIGPNVASVHRRALCEFASAGVATAPWSLSSGRMIERNESTAALAGQPTDRQVTPSALVVRAVTPSNRCEGTTPHALPFCTACRCDPSALRRSGRREMAVLSDASVQQRGGPSGQVRRHARCAAPWPSPLPLTALNAGDEPQSVHQA